MRLVAWNCNMALHRKFEALQSLNPDVAVISEYVCGPRVLSVPVCVARTNNCSIYIQGYLDPKLISGLPVTGR